jgi:hypothetical protein
MHIRISFLLKSMLKQSETVKGAAQETLDKNGNH